MKKFGKYLLLTAVLAVCSSPFAYAAYKEKTDLGNATGVLTEAHGGTNATSLGDTVTNANDKLNVTQPSKVVLTTTYNVLAGDSGYVLAFEGTDPSTFNLPSATSDGFTAGFAITVTAATDAVTLNPTGSTINGAGTLTIPAETGCFVYSDGTNYKVDLSACTSLLDLGGGGTGDVVGPASSVDGEVALFDSTTGKLLKRAALSGWAKLTSGVLSAITPGTGVETFVTTPSSANLRGALTDETGTGFAVFSTSPLLTTPQMSSIVNGAGTLSLPSSTDTLVGRATTDTLLNKRVAPRIGTTASSSTPTPDADANDVYTVTALAANATFGAPTGTPTQGQTMIIRIKDNGTARTLAFNAIYRAVGVNLPTTTVISKTMYIAMIYNAEDTKWDVIGVREES